MTPPSLKNSTAPTPELRSGGKQNIKIQYVTEFGLDTLSNIWSRTPDDLPQTKPTCRATFLTIGSYLLPISDPVLRTDDREDVLLQTRNKHLTVLKTYRGRVFS